MAYVPGTNSPARCVEVIHEALFEIALHPELIFPRYQHAGGFKVEHLEEIIEFHLLLGKDLVTKTKVGEIASVVLQHIQENSHDVEFMTADGFASHPEWVRIRREVRAHLSEATGYSDWDNKGRA